MFETWQGSGISKNAFAGVVDGMVFGDTKLNKNTVNPYLGIIEWAVEFFDDSDSDSDSLVILGEFNSVTELRAFMQNEKGVKQSNPGGDKKVTKKDKVETVDEIVARVKKMSKREQAEFKKKMGW